jgi:hypothetical protein
MTDSEENIASLKKTTYDREAQRKYREKNREKYNIAQRELYYKLHQSDEWRAMFNERSKRNNLLLRQKKREEQLRLNPNMVIRGRGRPRKNPIEGVKEDPIEGEGVKEEETVVEEIKDFSIMWRV